MPDPSPFSGKTILLGVCGSIAAYKAVDLASRLTQGGAAVPVVLTDAAGEFIRPLSFEAITHQPVHTGLFADRAHEPRHIALAEQADALLIAPATANILAKLAMGLADDLLSSVAMATRAPLIIAPAMNDGMYTHPATQANIELLRSRGAVFAGPSEGRLASGKQGTGRLCPVETILDVLANRLCQGDS